MNITLNLNPTDEDITRVREHLIEFNCPHIEHICNDKFVLDVFDADDYFKAGMILQIRGIWLEIQFLTVDETLRGKGIGKKLMSSAETFAREKGCQYASVETFSFQAQPFYEKLGYNIVYVQQYYPDIGQQKIYLTKDLAGNL